MEKKSWLWRRKPSERSPGETESSGSLSSFSGRLSEEQSPEVTSKSSEIEEEAMKSLTSKLSAALANVAAKDEMVKKHSRVTEEAVAGWEKAENEALELKKQVSNSVKMKLALEERVSHLDEALKECVRQLRQTREEQGHVALSKRLEHLEEENAFLRQELEVRTIEKDLSSQAAEAASKQHLDSIKKLAKLEAECRKIKFNKGSSELGKDACIITPQSSTVKIDLMEDFIEMEKLAALEGECKKPYDDVDKIDQLQERVRVLESQKFELEEKLILAESALEEITVLKKKLTSEEESRNEIESQLVEAKAECKSMVGKNNTLRGQLLQLESSFKENEMIKENLTHDLKSQLLKIDGESKSKTEKIHALEEQMHHLSQKIKSLTAEVEQERAFSMELAVKYEQLNEETEANQSQERSKSEAVTAGKLAECQKTILSLGNQLKSLATIEDLLTDTPTVKLLKENDGESKDSDKNRKRFPNFFAKSKNGAQIEI